MSQADRDRFLEEYGHEWLASARSVIAIMRGGSPDPELKLEGLCYHAQQAAERALKALVVRRGLRLHHTHDIGALLELLEKSGETIPDEVGLSRILVPYAVLYRYPQERQYEVPIVARPVVTEQDYESAVRIADRTVHWVESRLNSLSRNR